MENHVYIKKNLPLNHYAITGEKEREKRLNGHTDRRADRQTMTKE